jgi:hypothetical protein
VEENFRGWRPINSVSVLKKVRGGRQNLLQYAGELSRVQPKRCFSVLEEIRSWQPKIGVIMQAKYPGWHPKKCISDLEKCPGRQKKFRQYPGEMSRMATKTASVCSGGVQGGSHNGFIMQAKCRVWHPNEVSVLE